MFFKKSKNLNKDRKKNVVADTFNNYVQKICNLQWSWEQLHMKGKYDVNEGMFPL